MSSTQRKATDSRSSRSTPSVIKERPSADYARRDILYERVFPVYELEKREECKWTLEYLERNYYGGITLPFADFVYPRLVRLFYQNLKFGSTATGELYISFTVDGHYAMITTSDMGKITKLPDVYNDTLQHLKPPLLFPDDDSVIDFILQELGVDKSGGSVKLSSLPPKVWLLDKIMKENIYPLGNYTERRIDLLLAVYSAHEGYYFSIPYLLMLGIQKVSQELKNKTSPDNDMPLPYGFLITAILRYTEYFLDDHEPCLDIDALYPLSAWITCYDKLLKINQKNKEEKERRSSSEKKEKAVKKIICPEDSRDTADIERRLLNIEEQHDEIMKKQDELQNQQYISNLLMRVMARKIIGEDLDKKCEEELERDLNDNTNAEEHDEDWDEEIHSDAEWSWFQ